MMTVTEQMPLIDASEYREEDARDPLRGTVLLVNDFVQFTYHDKPRRGKVDKMKPGLLTLKVENDPESEYKSFRISKIEKFLGHVRSLVD